VLPPANFKNTTTNTGVDGVGGVGGVETRSQPINHLFVSDVVEVLFHVFAWSSTMHGWNLH
jgi:hypothetical protein